MVVGLMCAAQPPVGASSETHWYRGACCLEISVCRLALPQITLVLHVNRFIEVQWMVYLLRIILCAGLLLVVVSAVHRWLLG